MSSTHVSNCPRCGEQIYISLWSEPRPYGSTVAYEDMGEIESQDCDCDLTEDEIDDVFSNMDNEPYDPRY